VLYLGRVDRNKGCATLLEYFQEYADAGGQTTLVLAGPSTLTGRSAAAAAIAS